LIKIMLVDDETLGLDYLHQLINWEANGFQICAVAANGREAISMIGKMIPDLIIADVDMPGMNGVELIQYTREKYGERIRFIMLSSYDKYEYVRDSMRSGAIDYLLKHRLDAEGLLELLLKVKDELSLVEARPSAMTYIEKNWSMLDQGVTRTFIRNIVLGIDDNTVAAEDYFKHMSPIHMTHFIVVVMQIEMEHNQVRQTADEDKRKVGSTIKLIQQYIEQKDNGWVVDLDKGRYVLLISYAEERSELVIYQRLQACLQRISNAMRLYLNTNVTFGYGSICTSLTAMQTSYAAAVDMLDQINPQLINQLEIDEGYGITLLQEKDLMAAVESQDIAAVNLRLDEIFIELKRHGDDPHIIAYIFNELVHLADKLWFKSGNRDKFYLDEALPTGKEAAEVLKLDQLQQKVYKLYTLLINKLTEKQPKSNYSVHVQMAIDYIHQNYSVDISLEKTADRAGISASYLGRLFRLETNTYFNDYLNQVRIDMSKQLISSGKYKVKQIYERVGFTSYNYFFKVFKDVTGMTPQSYAKQF
jgi:two-component system response regulator YesN